MKIKFLIICVVLFSCKDVEQNSKQTDDQKTSASEPLDTDELAICPHWSSKIKIQNEIKFKTSSNAACSYSSIQPINFYQDLNIQFDTIIYYSKDRNAKIKILTEDGILRDLKNINTETIKKENQVFLSYYNKILDGNHLLSKNIRFKKSEYCLTEFELKNPSRAYFYAEKSNKKILWVVELSQVPINGDLTYKHFYFEYPSQEHVYYYPIGIRMINEFGERF